MKKSDDGMGPQKPAHSPLTTIHLEARKEGKPLYVVDMQVCKAEEGGTRPYSGVVSLPDGTYVARGGGSLSSEFLQKLVAGHAPAKVKRGRPANRPASIAKAAHELIAQAQCSDSEGKLTLINARAAAATALCFGNEDDPDSQAKSLRRAAENAGVFRADIAFPGGPDGSGAGAVLFESLPEVQQVAAGRIRVSGHAWLCGFGERKAEYVQSYSVELTDEDIMPLPEEVNCVKGKNSETS